MRHVPSTQPRTSFHPCEYRHYIYLCGRLTTSIEAFDLQSRVFLALSPLLPEHDTACLVFLESDELVVMSEKYVTRYQAGPEGHHLTQTSEQQHGSINTYSNMPPVVVSGMVYYVDAGEVYRTYVHGRSR